MNGDGKQLRSSAGTVKQRKSSRLQFWQGCHSYQIQNCLEEEHRAGGTCSDTRSVLTLEQVEKKVR